MRVKRCAAWLLLISGFSLPNQVLAAEVEGRRAGKITVTDQRAVTAAPRVVRKGDGRRWYPYKATRSDGNGGFCLATRWTTDPLRAQMANAIVNDLQNVINPVGRPDCPRTPRAEQVGALAQVFWAERVLPAPELKLQPPFAITGKPTYLEIVGEQHKEFEVENEIDGEMVVIEATSDYVVDWGDRFNPKTSVVTTSSQGGPWPDGDVTHVYTHTDPDVTISVTQRWTAVWSSGDDSGVLEGMTTTATVTNYRVGQIEAVRRR
jgi:hypothetical protein